MSIIANWIIRWIDSLKIEPYLEPFFYLTIIGVFSCGIFLLSNILVGMIYLHTDLVFFIGLGVIDLVAFFFGVFEASWHPLAISFYLFSIFMALSGIIKGLGYPISRTGDYIIGGLVIISFYLGVFVILVHELLLFVIGLSVIIILAVIVLVNKKKRAEIPRKCLTIKEREYCVFGNNNFHVEITD